MVRIVSTGATKRDRLEFPVMIYVGFSRSHDPREALAEARSGIARLVLNFVYYGALSPELEPLPGSPGGGRVERNVPPVARRAEQAAELRALRPERVVGCAREASF